MRKPVDHRRNLGRAVPGALKLNRCLWQLQAELVARPAGGCQDNWIGRALEELHGYDPSRDEWRHRACAEAEADRLMTQAILGGILPVWAFYDDAPGIVDPDGLGGLGHRSLAAGAYHPDDDWGQEHAARALWIKAEDWRIFLAATLATLDGKSVPAPKRSRGRPPKSGSQEISDAPLVAELAKLVAVGEPKGGAAMRVAERAGGGGTVESKARRLLRRLKLEGNS